MRVEPAQPSSHPLSASVAERLSTAERSSLEILVQRGAVLSTGHTHDFQILLPTPFAMLASAILLTVACVGGLRSIQASDVSEGSLRSIALTKLTRPTTAPVQVPIVQGMTLDESAIRRKRIAQELGREKLALTRSRSASAASSSRTTRADSRKRPTPEKLATSAEPKEKLDSPGTDRKSTTKALTVIAFNKSRSRARGPVEP